MKKLLLICLLATAFVKAQITQSCFPLHATTYTNTGGPRCVTSGDFNGDGRRDIATSNSHSSSISVYLGTGTGSLNAPTHFTVPYNGSPLQVILSGDFTSDGNLDLAAVEDYGHVYILAGSGTGSFTYLGNFNMGSSGWYSADTTDLNNDGKLDLVFANGSSAYRAYLGAGNGTFSGSAFNFGLTSNPRGITAADFNADGNKDIAIGHAGTGGGISVLFGTGTGTFGPVSFYLSGASVFGLSSGDFNSDGKPDLVAGVYNPDMYVLLNSGTGTFPTATSYGSGYIAMTKKMYVADFNGDSKPDILSLLYETAMWGGNPSVHLNKGNGIFDNQVQLTNVPYSSAASMGDFDNNGTIDFVASGTPSNVIGIYLNGIPALSVSSLSVCAGSGATISLSGAGTYSWSNNSGGNSITITPTSTTIYSVQGVAATGCTLTVIRTISVVPLPTVSVNSGSICSGQSFTINASGANTYSYSGGSATVSPVNTSSFTVTGTSTLTGCSSTVVASHVTVHPVPVIAASSGSICLGQSYTIVPSGASSYTFSGGSDVVSPLSDMSYSVSGTSSMGCTSTVDAVSNVTVIVAPIPTITVNSGSICSGQTFTIVPSGADTYTISGGTDLVAPLSNTNYIVTGTSSLGCISANAAIADVTVSPSPTISAASGSICSGNSFTIIAIGADTYLYSNAQVVAPGTNTFYTVSGTSSVGCASTNTAIVNVTVSPSPTISVNSGSICSGKTFTINATGAANYVYSGTSSLVAPATNTTYNVSGTSSVGCASTNTAIVTVSVSPSPTVSVNSGSICSGSSFTIVAGGADSYNYSSTTTLVAPATNTTYNVSGTSSVGCASTNTAVVTVTVSPSPTISVNSGSICSGKSFTIIATGADTYNYSSTTTLVAPATNTTYNVSGTSSVGCASTNTAVVTVTVSPSPTISVNSGSICSGTTFTINASGAASYIYSGTSSLVAPATNTTYNVSGTSSVGCVSTNTAVVTVTVSPSPTISVNSGSICSGNSFTILTTGADSYVYSSTSTLVAPATNTSYNVSGTSSVGCVSTNTAVANVTVAPSPTISVNSGSICSGNSFTILATGADSYVYSSTSTLVAPATNTSYNVSGTSSVGCVSTNTAVANVTVAPSPTVSVNSGSICAGKSFTLLATGADNYVYSSTSTVVAPATNTSYNVSGTSSLGCVSVNTAVANVTVAPAPSVSVNSGSICAGSVFTIVATGAGSYNYPAGSATVTPGTTTSYPVSGTSSLGCASSNTAVSTVTVHAIPVLTFTGTSAVLCAGETLTLTVSGADQYNWVSLGTTSAVVVSPTITTGYTVTGTSAFGCAKTSVITQSVDACTGIEQQAANRLLISLYPNPNNGEFTVESATQTEMTVIGALGQVILHMAIAEGKNQIDLNTQAKGLYFVRFKGSDKTIRLIKE